MKRLATFGGVACIAAVGIGVPSCADVLAIEDPELVPAGSMANEGGPAMVSAEDAGAHTDDAPAVDVQDGGTQNDVAVATDAPADVQLDVLADVPDTCPTEQVDAAHGSFVSVAHGTVGGACGTKASPCNSIGHGINHARFNSGVTTVYVDTGTYAEMVVLFGGLTIQGGWDFNPATGAWKRQCTAARAESVRIAPTVNAQFGNYGVRADGLSAPVTLDTLSIDVAAGGMANIGQSLYGVHATGSATTLSMFDVNIAVGNGGAGASGAGGTSGQNALAQCSGTSGANGSGGAPGAHAAAGTFGLAGYVPAAGAVGSDGASGVGTPGGPASSNRANQCVNVCGAPDGTEACNNSTTPNTYLAAGAITSTAGTGGCGGEGGKGGGGGGGGGSAFGVFVWDAHVTMTGGLARAGNGGGGGIGGAGGGGAAGAAGQKGADDNSCVASCVFGAGKCDFGPTLTIPGGAGGAAGGTGGQGGSGGGGSGGFSYAVLQNGAAAVTLNPSVQLFHGAAGLGAGGAPDGQAADRGTAP